MSKKQMKSMDGNQAAAHVAYAFTEVAAIYPITPSSPMAEFIDEWASRDKRNIFGNVIKVAEMQSEGGASGALHGSLQGGALTTTFTASQGLLLMIPNMYKIAGELLPAVFHVTARTLAAQALSIFGDHSDIYAVRQTGFAMLATGSVQEVMDLAGVAHLAAVKSRVPFLHFFDGFRTSHEIQKIEEIDVNELGKLLDRDALDRFRKNALNPEHPFIRGTAQNPDIFFQAREASNKFYESLDDIVEGYMQEITKITGREYHPFTYYGAPDAENIIIAMGSVTETTREVIDYLMAKGEKVGLINVHLYRPFSEKYLMKVFPKSVKRIAVLERTKEPGANGEPLYLDVKDLFYGKPNAPLIVGGRYGLSSKDTKPSQILAVYENLKLPEPKNGFTIGIVDDVTFKSLPVGDDISVVPEGTIEAKFYGLGSDGTVGANKNSIKIIGDTTELYSQAYFAYDSKKSGGVTVSHLRFGKKPIRSTYLISQPDFVACHVPSYIFKYDMLKGLKKGGIFLLNSMWDANETISRLPDRMKMQIAKNDINFYIINATKIAQDLGLGTRTNTIMQAAFFKLAKVISHETAIEEMKKAIKKSYSKKGDEIVNKNNKAVDSGADGLVKIEIPADWKNLAGKTAENQAGKPEFVTKIMEPMNNLDGDLLPVSAFIGREDGTFPAGLTAYEKRGIAVNVPEWIPENCIQCNQCSYVCPHAVIRPFLLDSKETSGAPAGIKLVDAKGKGLEGLKFKIQVSPLDCTGCGNCAQVCPAKEKALVMKPLESQLDENKNWDYMSSKVTYKDTLMATNTVKGSQFAQPLFEFSGACAGCGETPYIKLITQLYGDRMMIANATGCTSIYSASAPATAYCKNAAGNGPSWANSLFEDNAEYGFGMHLGVSQMRQRIVDLAAVYQSEGGSSELKALLTGWVAEMKNAEKTKELAAKIIPLLEKDPAPSAKEMFKLKQFIIKKSIWIFGGDGWAYDIGYGGLDHVAASGEDVNILVLDTEVYSNTGGQSSKATPAAAVAKFAASGKKIRKKDLGMMMMAYGYVYVAQVCMGSNQAQYLKALQEAESYPGPSVIIAYSPCINHGLRAGMGKSQLEAKMAVESGYWNLYRFDPRLEAEGKNPFQLDSKEPDFSKFQDFLMGEDRYITLKKDFPENADVLFKAAQDNAKWTYHRYKKLSEA